MIDINERPVREIRRWLTHYTIEHVRQYRDGITATNVVTVVGEHPDGTVTLLFEIAVNGEQSQQLMSGCTIAPDLVSSRPPLVFATDCGSGKTGDRDDLWPGQRTE